jgi:hypothetical protein
MRQVAGDLTNRGAFPGKVASRLRSALASAGEHLGALPHRTKSGDPLSIGCRDLAATLNRRLGWAREVGVLATDQAEAFFKRQMHRRRLTTSISHPSISSRSQEGCLLHPIRQT